MSFSADYAVSPLSESPDRIEEAGRICRSILAQTPDDAACLQLMGIIECKLRRPGESEIWFRKSLAVNPDSPETLCSYALALMMLRQFARAIPLLERATEMKADFTLALHHLGNAYKENGNIVEAVQTYEKLLTLKPDEVEVMYNLAMLAKDHGNLPAARAYCERAAGLQPLNPFCINNLGIIWYMMGDYRQALICYRKALELNPEYPEALSNLSMLMQEMGAFDQAVDYSSRALALKPAYPEALNNFGISLKDTGKLAEGIEVLRHAYRLNDQDPEIQYNLAIALLAAGEYGEGWRLHEARWKTRFLKDTYRKYPQPVWQGEAAEGRVLFIHHEQGLGDTLQFCRYAPMAAALGWRVVMEVQQPLLRLMKSLEGVEAVLARPAEPADFDFHCPMMSLPLAMQTRFETIPQSAPYLMADEKEVLEWGNRIAVPGSGKPRVGLVWAGCARLNTPSLAMTDRRRSISAQMLKPITQNENFHFFSLQKDGPKAPETLGLIDLMDQCRDFADTAALIANLDLVIAVDTAVAHLAGALGKPVWVLNRFDSCWRWQRHSEKTAWYSSMRLFHQPRAGDWASVIARMAAELAGAETDPMIGFGMSK
ncbi:MAG: tetratricopeptide repeat protein [Syntrophobacteraceae bacterium]|nr:tetratricopeptide repeat protein [Syntrophobacteraceae bacterium]